MQALYKHWISSKTWLPLDLFIYSQSPVKLKGWSYFVPLTSIYTQSHVKFPIQLYMKVGRTKTCKLIWYEYTWPIEDRYIILWHLCSIKRTLPSNTGNWSSAFKCIFILSFLRFRFISEMWRNFVTKKGQCSIVNCIVMQEAPLIQEPLSKQAYFYWLVRRICMTNLNNFWQA